MLATVQAPALIGIEGVIITIECHITNGLPGLVIVGLGDKAVDEAKERIRSAINNSGFVVPPKRITLNLAPADLPKDGSGYDLGLAMAILVASGQLAPDAVKDAVFFGELSLEGAIKPARGSLIAAQTAAVHHAERFMTSSLGASQAAVIEGIKVFGAKDLMSAVRHLSGIQLLPISEVSTKKVENTARNPPDFASIFGQHQAKRALEIATAGGHNILFTGPPGTGKTLLAKAAVALLPPLTQSESIELTKVYSAISTLPDGLIADRPFRNPHHTCSSVALIGGGSRPRPGEISLSHHGILFLDELPEFPRSVLEVLRQPLEDGRITIARAAGSLTFPANFMLIATANPCPCGYLGDDRHSCSCTQAQINRYQRRLSGPLIDRIDLIADVPRVPPEQALAAQGGEPSAEVAKRVAKAWKAQQLRQASPNTYLLNALLSNSQIEKHCKLNNNAQRLAKIAMENLGLSMRGYLRTVRVARTIADLEGSEDIQEHHVTEALSYRPAAR